MKVVDDAFLALIAVYGVLVFLVIPMFADSIYYRSLRNRLEVARGPSTWTEAGALAIGIGWVLWIAAATMPQYSDYTPAAKMSEGVLAASSVRTEIIDFYGEHKRLPARAEEAQFKYDSNRHFTTGRVKSVAYDSAAQMIVVTMRDPFPDKRFGIHVEVRDGNLVWTCRAMEIDKKYLPPLCRN